MGDELGVEVVEVSADGLVVLLEDGDGGGEVNGFVEALC